MSTAVGIQEGPIDLVRRDPESIGDGMGRVALARAVGHERASGRDGRLMSTGTPTRSPSTTTTTSPRSGSPSTDASTSAAVPRRTSSCSFVSSRHSATRRSPMVVTQIPEHPGHATRRLEEHQRARIVGDRGEPCSPLARRARQEALEGEPVRRQPAHDQRREHGRGPRHHANLDARLDARGDQSIAGVRDERHPTVGDEGHRAPVHELAHDRRRPRTLVALEERPQGGAHADRLEQPARAARVLRDDEIDGPEGLARAIAEIAEIPDRCRDDVQHPGGHGGDGRMS